MPEHDILIEELQIVGKKQMHYFLWKIYDKEIDRIRGRNLQFL